MFYIKKFYLDDSGADIKVDIQRISESIVQEIEKSFLKENTENSNGNVIGDKLSKGCFSNFFGPDCRKIIENIMRKNVDANSSMFFLQKNLKKK